MSSELVLLTRDRGLELAVAQALERETSASRVWTCHGLAELTARLEASPAVIALVDVDPQPLAALSELEPLIRRFGSTRFVLLCSELANELLFEAMQIGARHCQVKRSLGSELSSVVRRLAQDSPSGTPSGVIVSVLSTSGGCGATTLAINLAEELRLDHNTAVLLIDLDLDYGACSTFLGIDPQYGIADVLRGGMRIDSELLRSTAAKFRDDYQVLSSPASIDPAQAHALDLTHMDRLLSACRQTYRFSVVDAPRLPLESAARLARASAAVIVVFELAVIDVRAARTMINELEARGVDRKAIFPVANRYNKRGPMLRLIDGEKALGGRAIQTVRNDFDAVISSVNLGQPLADISPRSAPRKDIRELLKTLTASRLNAG